ncbi:MAG: sulfur transferase domain-containing protein [Hyphomicrobiaceae bacterium]|nr:TIGR01244 family phosphatase [Hyphomicrobiaceae bacterium]
MSETNCPNANRGYDASEPLQPFALAADIAIGRAPMLDELALLHAAGFRSVINNRPDTDANCLVTSEACGAAAQMQGLGYAHIPVEGRNPLEKDVRAFAEALASLPKPIYACCATGGRSSALWAMASVREATTDELIAKCLEAGFDVSGLKAKMDMRREMLEDDE